MKLLLKLSVTLILVAVIVWELGDIREVGALIARTDPVYVLLVLGVNTFDRVLMTFKWTQLLESRGQYLPLIRGIKIYCASMIWGMFLPATVGADAIRAFSTSRTGLDSNEVVASIVIERMIGFLSALLLALGSLLMLSFLGNLDVRFNPAWWVGGFMLLGTTAVFAASFSQRTFEVLHGHVLHRFQDTRIMRRLRDFHATYLGYGNGKKNLAKFFGLTIGEQLISVLQAWLIARGLGVEVNVLYLSGAVLLAVVISRIPISIGGLGVFDGVFMLLMAPAGVPAASAIGIAVVGRILQTVSWLPWWIAYVIDTGKVGPPLPIAEEG